MFRDRTNLYVSYRQSFTHHPYSGTSSAGVYTDLQDAPLIDGEAIELENMPPAWIDLSGKVDHAVAEIRREMGMLAALHKKNALPGFDDRSQQEREIEALTLHVTQSLHKCQGIVKQFGELSKSETDPANRRMSENIKIAMATKIQDASTMFRKMQSTYLRQLRKDTPLPGPSIPESMSGSGGSSGIDQDVALSKATLMETQAFLQEDSQNEQLRQREQEINKIAQGIIEVAGIFKDLQTMVIDQGTLLDRIDYNVENTNLAVKDADRELTKGAAYQKRTQKCKIILLLSLIVFGLLLVLIFKTRR